MIEILFLPREHKIHIFELTCIVLSIIDILMTAFSTIFRRIPKILQNLSEDHANVAEHFPTISEDCRRLSRKTRRYFDDTPTDLRSAVYKHDKTMLVATSFPGLYPFKRKSPGNEVAHVVKKLCNRSLSLYIISAKA